MYKIFGCGTHDKPCALIDAAYLGFAATLEFADGLEDGCGRKRINEWIVVTTERGDVVKPAFRYTKQVWEEKR